MPLNRLRMVSKVAGISILLWGATSAWCAEHPIQPTGTGKAYYVSVAGSDQDDGLTPQTAFRNITTADHLLERMGTQAGGSVIYVMPGVYTENVGPFHTVSLRADGRPGFPITLTSHEPEHPAILDGQADLEAGNTGRPALALDIGHHWRIKNLELRNGTVGIVLNSSIGSIVEDLNIHDIAGTGGINPSGIKLMSNCYDCVIRNNLVQNVRTSDGLAPQNAMGIALFGGNNCVVHNNELLDCGSGIRYKHHSTRRKPEEVFKTLIFRNRVERFLTGGIVIATDNARVFENVVSNGPTGFLTDYGDGAPYRNNCFYHNSLYGVQTGFYSDPNVESRDSIFRDNGIAAGTAVYVKGWETLKSSDHNAFSTDRFRTPEKAVATLADMQARGHDTHSLAGVALFADAPKDFALAKDSPARGRSSEGQHIRAYRTDSPDYVIGRFTRQPADLTPPDVSILSPTEGDVVSGKVEVSAQASDHVGVTGVQFMLGPQKLGALLSGTPFRVDWDTTAVPNGTYALTALARDEAGNVMTAMSVIVVVRNAR